MVLRLTSPAVTYLRMTHVFGEWAYVMWVGEPKDARTATRPRRKSLRELESMVSAQSGEWGQLELPPVMTRGPAPDSDKARELDLDWNLIAPLVLAFENEANLAHSMFSALIRVRAAETDTHLAALTRLVFRFYYFGSTRLGLLKLTRGPQPGDGGYAVTASPSEPKAAPKRRGRKAILSRVLGENDFVPGDLDIADMVSTLKSLLSKGPTQKSDAHERYLAGAFRRRHPQIHAEYLAGKRLEPVTARQFRYYVDLTTELTERQEENLRTHRRNAGHLGSIGSSGPGEVYEIDSTGGRIYLVSRGDPPVHLGKPWIYLLIDRWSRFVVSAYLTLKEPSYEEVRHALLIAFTSRERRFRALKVDIDDQRWPVGQMPATICPDRGAEFMSESMEQSVVDDLRIELTPLPPYCPDGKAIVERFIGVLKRRMTASNLKGTYADRPMDPNTKKAARGAKTAAVHSLAEAYGALIEIICDRNNKPHSALRKHKVLSQHGVEPTPKAAYLWGLKNIRGLRKACFTDDDYKRMLLATDQASLARGVLRYRQRPYRPTNAIASAMAARSTNKATAVEVRVDKSDPGEIFIVDSQGRWGAFGITRGGASEIAGITLDEEEVLSDTEALLHANAENNSRIGRVAAMSTAPKSKPARNAAVSVGHEEQKILRAAETDALKMGLAGKEPKRVTATTKSNPASKEEWVKQEEAQRRRMLELTRKQRGQS